ncbi:MAG: molybdopterin-dependent oxidoreductase [Parasphingorhabdus sp.]
MIEKVTFCRLCESHCGLIATVEDDKIVSMRPDPKHPVSKGFSCPKGVAMHEVVNSPDRVLYPSRKVKDGGFERISWETALEEIGERLNNSRANYGNDSIGLWHGNAAAFSYSMGTWVRGMVDALDTPHFYASYSQDSHPRLVASMLSYGSLVTSPVPDLTHTDFFVIVGANPMVSHGSHLGNIKVRDTLDGIVERGGRVLVVDPRRTETAKEYEHVPVRPDGDPFLLLAMLNVIFARGLEKLGIAEDCAAGLVEIKAAVKQYTPEFAEQHTGLTPQQITQLALDFAGADRAAIYGRVGACTSGFGTLVMFLIDVLNAVTGNLDKRGGTIFPTPPVDFASAMIKGGADTVGAKKSRIGGFPEVLGTMPGGIMADEINTPGKGQLRSLIMASGNPVMSIPESGRIKEAFGKLDLLVSIDFNINESNKNADYILPATTFLEREDLYGASSQFQIRPFTQWTEPVISPRGEAKQEWMIIRDICAELKIVPCSVPAIRKLGWLGRRITPQFMTDFIVRQGPRDGGLRKWEKRLSIKKLKKHKHGLLLDDRMPVGVLRKRLLHDDKNVHLFCDEIATELKRLEDSITADEEYPFKLFGRRELRSLNFWLKNANKLRVGERGPTCLIHPKDAGRLGLKDGELARIRSGTGAIEARFEVSDDIIPGSLCLPHGWSTLTPKKFGAKIEHFNMNDLTTANPHTIAPICGTAVLNGTRVQVDAIQHEKMVAN